MGDLVTLTIDGIEVSVPKGTLIVDAARQVGVDIPVFCYHPKMEPVGMCRMCLVEIGKPLTDRATGEVQRDADGKVKMWFSPKLDTACTTPVSEGMAVVTNTEKVSSARKGMLEFILTSHPLDCPVCDKGGECPLQNLTMQYGPTQSRFILDEKMHLEKHVPLGDLIYLDRERCIQCARCIRFQQEIVDDPVLGFFNRGRSTDIVTFSEPPFDSCFSGNTTDICPVGALTTADFRFEARPWQVKPMASICNHCPVGCNLVFDVRREARSGGKTTIKRVMPRQNEKVNEIWLCDKGRFGYHYTASPERLTQPLIRKDGELVPVEWGEALDLVSQKLIKIGSGLVTLAGGSLSNEDFFNLHQLAERQGGKALLYSFMSGGDLVSRFGVGKGTNLGDLGSGDMIVVAASDLHEEAPIWWLRIKQAVERGAELVLVHPRQTRLDKYAAHILRHPYGEAGKTMETLLTAISGLSAPAEIKAAAEKLSKANNLIVFYGSEGLSLKESDHLANTCAELLIKTDHIGRANNGLIAVWHQGNLQGGWDMGFKPSGDLSMDIKRSEALYIVAADPVGDDSIFSEAFSYSGFVIVQDLFLTETAKLADVVLPAQAFTEREGSFTSGERRVQRFYPAVPPLPGTRPDFSIIAQIATRFGRHLEDKAASLVMLEIAEHVAGYAGLTYQKLSEVEEQWPLVGRSDLYYGGTSYENIQGLGVQLVPRVAQDRFKDLLHITPPPALEIPEGHLRIVPLSFLYDSGKLISHSGLLENRMVKKVIWLNPQTAQKAGLSEDGFARISVNGYSEKLEIVLDQKLPEDVVLVPRHIGLPIPEPAAGTLEALVSESKPQVEE